MRRLSKILSYLFHPMLMPSLGTFFILNVVPHHSLLPFSIKRIVYIVVFASTCLLPLSLLPLFLQTKVIKSFEMETSRERIAPALSSAIFFFLGYFLLFRLNISSLIESFLLASFFAVILSAVISIFWKISLHALAIGGVTGLILALIFRYGIDLLLLLSIMVLISGIVATARLYLKAHTPLQVLIGYLVGLGVVLLSLLYVF